MKVITERKAPWAGMTLACHVCGSEIEMEGNEKKVYTSRTEMLKADEFVLRWVCPVCSQENGTVISVS